MGHAKVTMSITVRSPRVFVLPPVEYKMFQEVVDPKDGKRPPHHAHLIQQHIRAPHKPKR